MADDAAAYNLSVVRDLLLAAFTDEELRRLVRYTSNPALRPLSHELGSGDDLVTMADKAITYCEKRGALPDLLAEVKQERARQYARLEPDLRTSLAIPLSSHRHLAQRLERSQKTELASLYTDAVSSYFAERWDRAIELLSEIVSRDESYQDAATKLEEARRQKILADLYTEAQRLHQVRNWQAERVVFERIETLDPAYPDPEGLFAQLKRERNLSALYQQGLECMNAREWAEARKQFDEIQRLQVGYRETEALLARARRELASSGTLPDILTITSPIHLELIRIPAGEFLMGSDPAKDKAARDDEQPQHRVYVDEFYLGKYPVTNAQYAAFGEAIGHKVGIWGSADHPVIGITWHGAVAFCEWLSRETGQPYRLPTEAEWEKAARGDDGRLWPWGDNWDPARANASSEDTTPVSLYSSASDSPYGCADMAGNVCEWCSDWYSEDTYCRRAERVEKNPEGPDSGSCRVLRGGSSWSDGSVVRCASRLYNRPDEGFGDFGFRVARGPAR